ncbi:hypothetical protein F503_07486 [Ophiostoma piceae UAMH 11346]|uniref:Uncharacterized protein n=1 Tax=Ophiostoma piceae (strain UAMH 11346) TaxID=1262450 RepID=S3D8F3_OPHP1|nr:hypothetical protein F503_07486 [Ophiostoma piceae UAMH 11346]
MQPLVAQPDMPDVFLGTRYNLYLYFDRICVDTQGLRDDFSWWHELYVRAPHEHPIIAKAAEIGRPVLWRGFDHSRHRMGQCNLAAQPYSRC